MWLTEMEFELISQIIVMISVSFMLIWYRSFLLIKSQHRDELDSSVISTKDQQQALLALLKEMSSVFWGPDQEKCVALLKESVFEPFEKIGALPGLHISKALTEIRSILQKISNAEALYLHLDEAYVRLFISDREGVTAPLYASCYVNLTSGEKALLMGAPAIDMNQKAYPYQMKSMNRRITYRLNWSIFISCWQEDGQMVTRT